MYKRINIIGVFRFDINFTEFPIGTHSPFKNQTIEVEKNKAALYAVYENPKKSKKLLDNVTIANGMAWSKNGKKFFFVDSLAYTIESFSYDIKTDDLGE